MTLSTWLKISVFHIFAAVLLLPKNSYAQENGRMTEAEMSLQADLLEAQRQRILGNLKAAEAQLLELRTSLPEESTLFYELALVQNDLDKPENALDAIETAIELDPNNVWFLQAKANLAEDLGMFTLASETYAKLIDLNPDRSNYYMSQALMELKNEDPERAIEILNTVEDRVGIMGEISEKKHMIYDLTGDRESAARELEALVQKFPYNVDYRILLGQYYHKIGDDTMEKKTYEDILKIDPDNSAAQTALLKIKSGMPDNGGQLAGIQDMLNSRNIPLDEKIMALIPSVQKFADELDPELGNALLDAAETLKSIHQPKNAKILALEADVYYHMQQKDKAIDLYKMALKSDDTNYLIWEQLMFALQELDKINELLEYAEEASDLFPNKASALYLQSYAMHQTGKSKRALPILKQAEIIGGSDAWLQMKIAELSGDIYFELEDNDQALIYWERSVRMGNSSDLLKQKIEQLKRQN
jgi:tetratricopeptide (TPR) repeat protein